MKAFPFIFSNELNYRLSRHVTFWMAWWVFQGMLYAFSINPINLPYFQQLPVSLLESAIYLIPHMFLSYSLMFWVVPSFILKSKYLNAALSVVLLFIVTAAIAAMLSIFVISNLRFMIWGDRYKLPIHVNEISFFVALLAGLRGGITIGGIAAAIKLMKLWYIKEQKNLQLQKENLASQLQLLKAQVHPHFLFNTLNNIYSHTQNTSEVASKLVMGLSDMLRYMLYETEHGAVPLSKEIKLLQDYTSLESIRYGNKLDVTTQWPVSSEEYAIQPLLLLPFLENSFKHGTSRIIDQPWVSLAISIDEGEMKMKLINGKPFSSEGMSETEISSSLNSGIGITNVQKRLELLYPGRHQLEIRNEEEVFIVNLQIKLERISKKAVIPTKLTQLEPA